MTMFTPDSSRRTIEPPKVSPDDIRTALFTQRRPAVRPLFDPDRPVGVAYQPAASRASFLDSLRRFFHR